MICAAPVAKGPGELPEQYNGEDHVYSTPFMHALIGNIDGDANLEILGSSNGSNPIYAIKADGTFVPGWPISNPYGMGYLGLGPFTANSAAEQVFAGFWGTVEFAYDGNGNVLRSEEH